MTREPTGNATIDSWRSLVDRQRLPTLAVLLGGILVQSTNVLMLTTVLPSVVGELGGVNMMSWPTSAFLAASIVAASCAARLTEVVGPRVAYSAGSVAFGLGALACALASSMGWVVAGRIVQGLGGGLEVAVAYIVVRTVLPAESWARAIALMSTGWSVSVFLGPLLGGLFARFGSWRGAFFVSAALAVVLSVAAFTVLPSSTSRQSTSPRVPGFRLALICLAIISLTSVSAIELPVLRVAIVLVALGALYGMLRLDSRAPSPLLPRDAFSWSTPTGVGLWLALLLCIAFSPLQIYVPLFLQRLHGFDPLSAGFTVATASLAWTVASLVTAGASGPRSDRLILAGPVVMIAGLAGIGIFASRPGIGPLIVAIALLGVGIGQCWPFVAKRVMGGAKPGDEVVAAGSVPTVQQLGFALGAAAAGTVATALGLSGTTADDGILRAAVWLPVSFSLSAVLAFFAAVRLCRVQTRQA